ncbi:uncharacterized protein LOC136092849 [Hydra vulgaris]|uniref:uncharacterized protein LOC136092849 n=1 Tax=Hydra vulgaris TaxID=6087 RepID=UPI0032E9CA14
MSLCDSYISVSLVVAREKAKADRLEGFEGNLTTDNEVVMPKRKRKLNKTYNDFIVDNLTSEEEAEVSGLYKAPTSPGTVYRQKQFDNLRAFELKGKRSNKDIPEYTKQAKQRNSNSSSSTVSGELSDNPDSFPPSFTLSSQAMKTGSAERKE